MSETKQKERGGGVRVMFGRMKRRISVVMVHKSEVGSGNFNEG